jgi:hypothetical protein
MSGGQYNYAYSVVMQFIEDVENEDPDKDRYNQSLEGGENYILRKKFLEHLILVADAMRAIEWNDSGDGASDERDLILKVIDEKELE